MNRRTVLKAAGLSLLLPRLESFGEVKEQTTKRLLTIVNHLSFYQPALVPGFKKGTKTELLDTISENKNNLKLFSGFDNPGVQLGLGHTPCVGILSGYFNKLNRKNRISIDQQAAEVIGSETRFKSLSFQAGQNLNFSQVCWDKHGLPVKQIDSPEAIFQLLFGVKKNKQEQQAILIQEKSILDLVYKQAKSMNKSLNNRDKNKIDEYFTSIREVEKNVQRKKYWTGQNKPETSYKVPRFSSMSVEEYIQVMLDLSILALKTDSTRVVTLQVPFWETFKQADISGNYHNFSHHGQDPKKIEKLLKVEKMVVKKIDQTVSKLKEGDGQLFDETSVLVTAAMANASAHTFNDLPALYFNKDVKSFKHERHEKKPICTLYNSILQNLGCQNDKFGESQGTVELNS